MTLSFVLWILLVSPLGAGGVCWMCRSPRTIMRIVRVGVSAVAVVAGIAVWASRNSGTISAGWGWLYLDALSAYHLAVMMVVFILTSLYVPSYFEEELRHAALQPEEIRRFALLWFGALAAMMLVLLSNNIGMMWVGLEATTLITAFLICVHRTPESMEATWKYLIICSVGVTFAFMGTLLAGAAANGLSSSPDEALLWTHLREHAARLHPLWIKVAFVFLLVGYGTKAGLAPMHNWLPDAHSQAPAPISALFSGFMLNASLYCIMRYLPLVEGSLEHSGWSLRLMLIFGLMSVLVAVSFIVVQRDLKRLLAYSSVEHMGIISVGLGLSGLGTFAALLHLLNHCIGKPLAFFAAGRLGQMYGTHDISKMAGTLRAAPVWGAGLLGALLVLIGVAPFGMFLSEFLILRAAAHAGSYWTMGLFLIGAAVVFMGVLQHALSLAWGDPVCTPSPEHAQSADKTLVVISLGALLVLGLFIPAPLSHMLQDAAKIVEGTL